MRCKRICRELLWLARFGEFGPSSAPHLDHLSRCGTCRDEVGFDRALVQQLRCALAERIANDEPSPRAWDVILERAQAPERGLGAFLRGHAILFAHRLRTATAVSAIALAGVIATSTQVTITHPEAGSAETEVRSNSPGDRYEQQPVFPRARPISVSAPVVYVPARPPRDPELAFQINASLPPSAVEEPAQEESPAEEGGGDSSVTFVPFNRMIPVDPVDAEPAPQVSQPAAPRDGASAGRPY